MIGNFFLLLRTLIWRRCSGNGRHGYRSSWLVWASCSSRRHVSSSSRPCCRPMFGASSSSPHRTSPRASLAGPRRPARWEAARQVPVRAPPPPTSPTRPRRRRTWSRASDASSSRSRKLLSRSFSTRRHASCGTWCRLSVFCPSVRVW